MDMINNCVTLPAVGTAGPLRHGSAEFCRVPGLALGKAFFAECNILLSATLGKIFLC
jgi:hypothetical protein